MKKIGKRLYVPRIFIWNKENIAIFNFVGLQIADFRTMRPFYFYGLREPVDFLRLLKDDNYCWYVSYDMYNK